MSQTRSSETGLLHDIENSGICKPGPSDWSKIYPEKFINTDRVMPLTCPPPWDNTWIKVFYFFFSIFSVEASQCINKANRIQNLRKKIFSAISLKKQPAIPSKITLLKCPCLLRQHILNNISIWIFVLWGPSRSIVDFICWQWSLLSFEHYLHHGNIKNLAASLIHHKAFFQLGNTDNVKASSVHLDKTSLPVKAIRWQNEVHCH